MNEETLRLLRDMVSRYVPEYPWIGYDWPRCGYCKEHFTNRTEFDQLELHTDSCTYAAAVRHLAAVDAESVEPQALCPSAGLRASPELVEGVRA